MRILFSTTAGGGHFGPLVPFANACRDAGHDVIVAAPASFAPVIERAGLVHGPFDDAPPEQLGAAFARLADEPVYDERHDDPEARAARLRLELEVVIGEVFGRIDATAALPGMRDLVTSFRPDVIVHEPAELSCYIAAEEHRIPRVLVSIGLSSTGELLLPALSAPLNELRATVGLPADPELGSLQRALSLTCWPAALEDPDADLPDGIHRFRDASAGPDPAAPPLPGWWASNTDPLVYVSFGSVAANLEPVAGVYADAVEALSDLPARVLVTVGDAGDPEALGPLPSNVHIERWWPQREVMPHTAAMVGHGGFGTTLLGVAAGVPMAVVPLFAADQRMNADRIAAAGAGIAVDGGPAGVVALAAPVTRLLEDPSYRAAAAAIASEIAALPEVAESVPLIEAWARSATPR